MDRERKTVMKKGTGIFLSLIMGLSCGLGAVCPAYAQTAGAETEGAASFRAMASADAEYAQGQLIAVYDDDISNRTIRSDAAAVGELTDISGTEEQKMALITCDTDEVKAAETLEKRDNAAYIQPNYKYETAETDPFADPSAGPSYQYYLKTTRAEEAWGLVESEPSHERTIVGVVDTGVDSRHEDLGKNLITDGPGGRYRGYICGEETNVYDDNDGHGTHVAGIIGAEYGNGKGGCGIASGHDNDLVQVLPACAKMLYTYDICLSIDYEAEQGARVINMSFGSVYRDSVLEDCIRGHYENEGIVFVAASGNENSDGYCYPADYPTVISVNAATVDKEAAYYSNYGKSKDVSGPGSLVMSTFPGDEYMTMSGTSMASPAVSGICGLILDVNPQLSPAQVRNILCASTEEALAGKGFDKYLAYGNVNAYAAVQAARDASGSVAVQELTIKEKEAGESTDIRVGETGSLMARILPATCLTEPVWTSSEPSVVTVDQSGQVTGVSAGRATITVSCGGMKAETEVRVREETAVTVTIRDKEKLKEIPYTGDMSRYGMLKMDVTPADTDISQYSFVSADPDILLVEPNGMYIPRKTGKTTLMIKDSNGKVCDQMDVEVKNAITEIGFTKMTPLIEVGKTFVFEAEILDEDACSSDLTYSVSSQKGGIDPGTGVFTAKKAGTCYVVATADNDVYGMYKVVVTKGTYAGKKYGLKAKKKGKKAKLTWNTLPGEVKYQVQKKRGGGWKTVKTVSTASYTDRSWKTGTKYRVRALLNVPELPARIGWSSAVKAR